MTAALLSFPSQLERDEAEFARSGTSNYTKAFDEAVALWAALAEPLSFDRVELARRVAAFTAQVAHLARYRPDCLGDIVATAGIELQLMPAVLRAAMVPRAAND